MNINVKITSKQSLNAQMKSLNKIIGPISVPIKGKCLK